MKTITLTDTEITDLIILLAKSIHEYNERITFNHTFLHPYDADDIEMYKKDVKFRQELLTKLRS